MSSTLHKKKGFRRLVLAIGYSWKGLVYAFRNEEAFRVECMLTIVVVPAAFYFGSSALETAVLLLATALVLIAELTNTAIEAAVDRVSTEHHTLAGAAKDAASAVVLVSIIAWSIIWGCILLLS